MYVNNLLQSIQVWFDVYSVVSRVRLLLRMKKLYYIWVMWWVQVIVNGGRFGFCSCVRCFINGGLKCRLVLNIVSIIVLISVGYSFSGRVWLSMVVSIVSRLVLVVVVYYNGWCVFSVCSRVRVNSSSDSQCGLKWFIVRYISSGQVSEIVVIMMVCV